MKRLIICCDGTWNAPEKEGAEKSSSTNVLKILRAIAPVDAHGVSQIRYYCQGVGTGNILDRFTGGAFGKGLSDHIQECYRFLANNYCPGDEIYIFGFSRGAFTARSLGGLIGALGLITPRQLGKLPDGWKYYRMTKEERETPDGQKLLRNLDERIPSVPIKLIGVWDTVGSLGIPGDLFSGIRLKDFEFHDVTLGANVETALHAIAIDEKRKNFMPTLWDKTLTNPKQIMEQVWFAGVHSNVGGGYPDNGLSDCALDWMIRRVEAHTDLEFDPQYIDQNVRKAPGNTLYDSSDGFPWSLLGEYVREIALGDTVHRSVDQRRRAATQPSYTPGNLPPDNDFTLVD